MKDKYEDIPKQFLENARMLADSAGWTEKQAQEILRIMVNTASQETKLTFVEREHARKNVKVEMTRHLLKNYRRLKDSIENAVDNTLQLIDDTEYQRLMEREESVQNQQVRSLAIQTAANRVLWVRLNTALDSFKVICERDSDARIRRQYTLIYEHYLCEEKKPIEQILSSNHIEKSAFYSCLNDGLKTLSLILFGAENVTDFFINQTAKMTEKGCRSITEKFLL